MSESTGCSSELEKSYNSVYDDPAYPIPVHLYGRNVHDTWGHKNNPPAWYEEFIPRKLDRKQSKLNLKTVKMDNRLSNSDSLPILSVSNVRSLLPKIQNSEFRIQNFKMDLAERDISLSLLSEVWEKQNCKKQQKEFDNMLNIDGLKYISTPRLNKRGGGAAIVVSLKKFSLDKIEIGNPDKVEVVWGLVRPRIAVGNIKEIICSAFYSPPKSRKNSLLLDHLVSTTHYLLSKYPNAGLVLGGDKNNLNLSALLSGIPRLRQIVTKNTYKNKVQHAPGVCSKVLDFEWNQK